MIRETKTNRRKFLRDIAAAGGLAAVAGTTHAVTAAPAPKPAATPSHGRGYRETAHIAKYYDKARI